MDAVSKLTIEGIKLSLFRIERMVFQSETSGYSLVSSSRHIDSNASFTMAGGLAIERTSDNCFFLMPLTADGTISTKRFCILDIRNSQRKLKME